MHSFHHMLVVDVKHQKLNKIQLSINHQANMSCLITTTKLLLLLSIPSTYANQNKTSSSSEDVLTKEDWIDNISPTINNLLIGFDCQNPS